MPDSDKLAIAAHLHVLLRRKTGRVTDTEWMASNVEYALEIVRFARQRAQEDNVPELVEWADRLDLAAWAPLVRALVPMPDASRDVLVALAPVGALNNLLLDYYPQREGAERLQFAANLDKVGIQAYRGAPAAENVSGSASGNMFRGEQRLKSENFASLPLELRELLARPTFSPW